MNNEGENFSNDSTEVYKAYWISSITLNNHHSHIK